MRPRWSAAAGAVGPSSRAGSKVGGAPRLPRRDPLSDPGDDPADDRQLGRARRTPGVREAGGGPIEQVGVAPQPLGMAPGDLTAGGGRPRAEQGSQRRLGGEASE